MTSKELAQTLVVKKINEQIKELFNDSHLLAHFTQEELKQCNDELIRIAIEIEGR